MLAERLGVPFVPLRDAAALAAVREPLLSFKVSEMGEDDRGRLREMLPGWSFDVYLHDFSGLELELELVRLARHVWCGNHEIREQIEGINSDTDTVWTPGLLMDQRLYQPCEISVFSFGMAHKIQTARFRRLAELLERSGRTFSVYVSSATHETKSIEDSQSLYDEMHEIFPRGLYFLGNLSDVAVFNQLEHATFFASFFPKGVRANNTSIAGAMEQGNVVITNLDQHSPPHLVHMENVIDIEVCDELPSDPLVLKRLGLGAMEAGRARSWQTLADRIAGATGDG